jgi:integrase
MATFRIDTVEGRARLKPRHTAYFVRVLKGCSLGFRKVTKDGTGAWITRFRDPVTKKTTVHSLGAYDELVPSERFDAARRDADKWFAHLGHGGSTKIYTVRQACSDYQQHVHAQKGDAAANDLARRYDKWVAGDAKLADVPLSALTRAHLEAWRSRLAATPVTINYDKKNPKTRKRAAGTVNRDITAVRAALNHALDHGKVVSDKAWRVALRPTPKADGSRDLYLDLQQRRQLVDAASPHARDLLWAMATLPLRPGAVAALQVGWFDKHHAVLKVGTDKMGKDRRIQLPPDVAERFVRLADDRPADAPLIPREDGGAWRKEDWKIEVKLAAAAAKLPASTVAYTLRHSTITDLVTKTTLPLLTVAHICGTSVRMIELHYGHHRADSATGALATLAL